MSFWQENYAFIKDVYDTRANKLTELMDKTENAIKEVVADKIYTSEEFKKVKETFAGFARNLEQPEVKDWLANTKDLLMGEKSGPDKEKAAKALNEILERFDVMSVKITDTKAIVDCLWKCYQYTDELAPLMEWLEESITKSTREIQSNSVAETEQILERHEKNLDQLDKKKKVFLDQKGKGEKLLNDPRAPKFLNGHMDRLMGLWKEANNKGEDRLEDLKNNLVAWEAYENKRNQLDDQLNQAQAEYQSTVRVYDLEGGPKDHTERLATASKYRKQIEETFKGMSGANDELAKLLEEDKKDELAAETSDYKERLSLLNDMDERLKMLDEFNGQLKAFDGQVKELEDWLPEGRKRMDDLLNPDNPVSAEDRVVQTMELQSDTQLQTEAFAKVSETWNNALQPSEPGESTPEAQEFVTRQSTVESTQLSLYDEVKQQSAKFGDDVKYLAEFTAGVKKFDPWIQKADAKRAVGMLKPKNLQEALDQLEGAKNWKTEAEEMKVVLDHSHESAQKMTSHADADAKYAAYKKRWEVIDVTAKDWIVKYEKMVEVWKKQAETAEKVTAAISAKPAPTEGGAAPEMKLEDLEKHLNALKEMFIQKQAMMEELEKSVAAPGPDAAPAAPAPEAPPAAPAPAPEIAAT